MAGRNYEEEEVEEEEEDVVVEAAAALSAPESQSQPPSPPFQGSSLAVEPSRRWREETDRKLSILAQRMAVLVTSEGWRVRRGVALWAHCLLGHCHRTLVTMVPTLLEVLVTLSHDDYQQVASCSLCSLVSLLTQSDTITDPPPPPSLSLSLIQEAFSSQYAEGGKCVCERVRAPWSAIVWSALLPPQATDSSHLCWRSDSMPWPLPCLAS